MNSDTPESDEVWNGEWNHAYLFSRMRKLERERDAARNEVAKQSGAIAQEDWTDLDAVNPKLERLNLGLRNLASWCLSRTEPGHNIETTLTMLERKVLELREKVRKV